MWTDRFGTVHAYQAQNGDTAAFGTCYCAVADLASRQQLDWRALTGFFGCGFFPQDQCFFETAFACFRPAQLHYVFDARGKNQRKAILGPGNMNQIRRVHTVSPQWPELGASSG